MEKNSRFAIHADSSFALRGLLSGTSGNPRMDRVHQKLPSHGILSAAQPRISVHGSRAIHVTRALANPTRGVPSNRPLSPHLPIKKPQFSASFSISHRIFGASLASAIMLVPIAWKYSLLYDV